MIRPNFSLFSLTVLLLATALSCGDPVHDNQVAALGPEPAGSSPGPTHRPGQPCLVCHDGSGPGNLKLSVAGTVYAVKGQTDPLPNTLVTLTDATGSGRTATTNSVGNFLVPFSEWAPTAPINVALSYPADVDPPQNTATMKSHIGRDGSCASCHYDPPGPATPGRVYMVIDPQDLNGGTGQ